MSMSLLRISNLRGGVHIAEERCGEFVSDGLSLGMVEAVGVDRAGHGRVGVAQLKEFLAGFSLRLGNIFVKL